jgi:hypothetical protein
MHRMLDLIRNSQVPSNLMQSAARGSLSVPADEMIEILVHLALHNKIFGEQARLTLAGWDEKASLAVASNPTTSAEVLGYFVALENLRSGLLPALAENPTVAEKSLVELATEGTRSVVEGLLASPRVMTSSGLLKALRSNPNLRPNELADVGKKLAAFESGTTERMSGGGDGQSSEEAAEQASDPAAEEALTNFLKENATELETEKENPFQPIGMIHESTDEATGSRDSRDAPSTVTPAGSTTTARGGAAAPGAAAHAKKHQPGQQEKRDSTLQKIAKLDVKGRIALAVRGGKEERSILIRDGTKLVALAVLDSPKITDGEVEGFALQKNVLEAVLRQIPLKRRFAKNYAIMRNLVYNPRTPLDLSLGLMKNLLIHDLKNLSGNKEVSETIRKLALRMYKQKMEKKD